MPNTKCVGDSFEQLTKLYFLINPQNTYKINWKGWADFLGKED